MRLSTSTAYRALAIALVASLCVVGTAFAAPVSVTATSTAAPKATPKATKPKPAPSVIPVPTDAQTEAFRAELARRQARMEEFKSQLDQLDAQLEIATEAYNQAAATLKDTQERLNATRSDLGTAQDALDEQSTLLDTRVEAMYRDGTGSTAEILLAAQSIPEFFQRLQFITTISSADADLAKQLANQRDSIAGTELDLRKSELEARSLEFALRARKMEIQYRITERQQMLTSAQADLAAMLDTEAKKRLADELGVWQSILRGAKDLGVTVEKDSPVETALSYHGIPYVWGGATPAGFDCSGLTMYVYAQHGVTLPHHAASQYLLGEAVDKSALAPGDLVFFGSPIHHVGMYIGGGYYVQAPRTGDFVKVSRLADRNDLVGARRYPWRYRVGPPLGVTGVSLPSGLPKH
jgi:peptidoglycan DL-endopeptidase CwlO